MDIKCKPIQLLQAIRIWIGSDPTNRVPDFSVHETVEFTQTVSCLICRSGCIDREEELNECNYVELRK